MLDTLVKNWSLKVIALGLAVGLWFFVSARENAEVALGMPVELTNIPRNLLVVGGVTREVSLRISGPQTMVRRLASQRVVQGFSLTGAGPGEHTFHVTGDNLNLPRGVEVVSISPAVLKITLAPRVSRELPVRPVLRSKPAQGFEVGEISFNPATVTVRGSQKELDEIDWLWTVPIDVSGLKVGATVEAKLRMPPGKTLRLDRNWVEATISIRPKPDTPKEAPKPPRPSTKPELGAISGP